MNDREQVRYHLIAEAIDYIRDNFKSQPGLDDIAAAVHLSPFHFQRLFHDWAGTTPKKFLQYISLNHAKKMLHGGQATLFDTAFETGLSGSGRLHELFVNIEGMTPAEYKNGGERLTISYSFGATPFGQIIVAATPRGVCHMAFCDSEDIALATLQQQFPKAAFRKQADELQLNALSIFNCDWNNLKTVKLHLKGTDFQLKVWEALLKIPVGGLTTYSVIASQVGKPDAQRAVGTAVGSNPVAYLVPCHRVIRATGALGGYMWGETRKTAIIGWESALTHSGEMTAGQS